MKNILIVNLNDYKINSHLEIIFNISSQTHFLKFRFL